MDAVQSPAWIRPKKVSLWISPLVDLQPVELDGDAVEVALGDPAHDVLEQRGRHGRGEMALGGRALQTSGSLSAAATNRGAAA